MTGKLLMIATAITTALLISAGAYAGGGMGGWYGRRTGTYDRKRRVGTNIFRKN